MASIKLPSPSNAPGGRDRNALPDPANLGSAVGAAGGGGGIPQAPLSIADTGQGEIPQGLINLHRGIQKAEERVKSRQDTVDRAKLRSSFNTSVSKLLNDRAAEQDFSDPNVLQQFGAELGQLKQAHIAQHRGSPDSAARLEVLLGDIEAQVVDRASAMSVEVGQKRVQETLGESLNPLVLQARRDPANVFALFDRADAEINEVSGALFPQQEMVARRAARASLAEAAITGHLMRNERDTAFALLGDPRISQSLGHEKTLQLSDRIANMKPPARFLVNDEVKALGLPEGFIVKQTGGDYEIVHKPEKDNKVRDEKIKAVTQQLVATGQDENAARQRAINIVDGNIRFEIVPSTGEAREVNAVTGEVKVVPLGGGGQTAKPAPQEKSLFDLARSGAIAGVVPAIKDFAGRTLGQIPGVPVAADVIEARQQVRVAQNELIRALSINPRFPVAEIERIRGEVQIDPAAMDSQRALLSRMSGIDKGLRVRLANEDAAASDPNLPPETRAYAAQASKDIRNFLNRLGIPPGFDANRVVPEGVPDFSTKIGVTREGHEVWQDPTGARHVVEK